MGISDVDRIDMKEGPPDLTPLAADVQSLDNLLVRHVRAAAQNLFEKARGSHDWEHTLRVYRLCRRIGAAEGADGVVLSCAAYLHDIGRCYQDVSNGSICHAEKGAQMAGAILAGLALSPAQKENVIHCVRSHRFRKNYSPRTLEARALFDADKLDAIGAIGVGRAFLFAGEVGARLHNPHINIEEAQPYSIDDTGYREYKVKLCKILGRIMTREGRKIAEDRHNFMEQFFNRFLEEYEGKR
ncbi:MAG: HD domain-containing protein [Desulfobacterales bacterium]|nr:HD domain-containing protein [Desulfobacterales bacterium]